MAVVEQQPRHSVGHAEGQEARQQSEDKEVARAAAHALQVHLQTGEEQDVVETYLSENLE